MRHDRLLHSDSRQYRKITTSTLPPLYIVLRTRSEVVRTSKAVDIESEERRGAQGKRVHGEISGSRKHVCVCVTDDIAKWMTTMSKAVWLYDLEFVSYCKRRPPPNHR